MIRYPPSMETEEVPLEVRNRQVVRGLATRIRILYEAIVEKFGDEGLELIRDVSRDYGESIARRVRDREGKMEIADVGHFVVRVFNNVLVEGEVTEFDEDRIAIKATACPYPFTSPEICEAHTTMEEALVRGLNEDLDYFIERSIPRGDPFCLHVICRK
ncbi:hypothetical protein AMJ39_04115 [candidate division TA06 bacterium DG_24]|uniref:Metanogen output domain-containing protein n=3 Tax=Bacteria division TA06 TaxID=1156500 RepID=A0A0S8J9K9_UNCT6|nr:MAG: hypothetical protein AMJ39_04115 [candidate division TA06 bacterium DG_24]KPK70572.1 MAG: hypothetical protein AMJ82_02915 [candidate division TA06 bacterium SM23_40]KPL06431.1 MAG: hypothetical protein AMJ71_09700 [candidate division TA06 bacterium SM1_40]